MTTPSPKAPITMPDSYTMRAGSTLVVDAAQGLLANDSDPQRDTLQALWMIRGAFPFDLQAAADGGFTLQSLPPPLPQPTTTTSVQVYTVPYLALDKQLHQTGGTVTIQVINDAPVAVSDHYRVHGCRSLIVPAAYGVLANDSDADHNTLSASGQLHQEGVNYNVSADGSLYLRITAPAGQYSFPYRVADAFGGYATGSFSVEVCNELPRAGADELFAHAQSTFVLDPLALLANDSDADLDPLVLINWQWDDLARHGTVQRRADGAYTFKARPGTQGDLQFHYIVSDGVGGRATGAVTLHVGNRAPQAEDDVYPVQAGQRLTLGEGGVLRNDHDAEGDPLSVVRIDTEGLRGQLALGRDGSVDFMPEAGFVGTTTARFVVADGWGGFTASSVRFVVQPGAVTQHAPVAADDRWVVTSGGTVSLPVLANDTDPDPGQTLRVDAVHAAQMGRVTLLADGTVRYSAPRHWNGTDRFEYTLTDGMGGSVRGQVVVDVAAGHRGTAASELINGDEGNGDSIDAGAGDDVVISLTGDDFVRGGDGNDHLQGGHGFDVLLGGPGNDTLEGGPDGDVLVGGPGADTLFTGDPRLRADSAGDLIVFDQLPTSAADADRVIGFSARSDRIALDPVVFAALRGGPTAGVDATEFVVGAGPRASEPDDHLLWDVPARTLSYDPDGNGPLPAVLLATFEQSGVPLATVFTLDMPVGL